MTGVFLLALTLIDEHEKFIGFFIVFFLLALVLIDEREKFIGFFL
jgi:hypothetical protein